MFIGRVIGRPVYLLGYSDGAVVALMVALGGLSVDVGGTHCRSRGGFRGPMLSPHGSARAAGELSGSSGLIGGTAVRRGCQGVGVAGGGAEFWTALRSVGLLTLSDVSGANESGEPNGEPTPADARPHQATTSHGFRS
jgi:hypothetical protein